MSKVVVFMRSRLKMIMVWRHHNLVRIIQKGLIIIWTLLLLPVHEASAGRPYVPEFQWPVLIGDKLVFAVPEFPGFGAHRLICIAKQDGRKIWEKTDEKEKMQPLFVLNNQLIVTAGDSIRKCDPDSGKFEVLYRTGFDQDFYVENPQDGTLLVGGAKTNVDYLALVDCNSWRKLWEVPRITVVIAAGQDAILCEEGIRVPVPGGGYSLRDQRWLVLSKSGGKVLWACSWSPDAGIYSTTAVAVSNFFLVYLDETIQCLNQRDGTTVSRFKIQRQPDASVQIMARGQDLLVKTSQFQISTLQDKSIFFALSVPDLKWRKLSEDKWNRAMKDRWEVRDGSYLYYPSITSDWQTTSMNRREIKTGHLTELYQESVPAELRRKPVPQRGGIQFDTRY